MDYENASEIIWLKNWKRLEKLSQVNQFENANKIYENARDEILSKKFNKNDHTSQLWTTSGTFSVGQK